MDEFINNYVIFRDWLYNMQYNCQSPEQRKMIDQVVNKFESLELQDAF